MVAASGRLRGSGPLGRHLGRPRLCRAGVALAWMVAVAGWARRGEAVDALAPDMLAVYGVGTAIVVVVLIVRLRTMGVRWHLR